MVKSVIVPLPIDFGYNRLHKAIIHNDEAAVKRLINDDMSMLQTRDSLGFSPLHVAALLGRTDMLVIILEALAIEESCHTVSDIGSGQYAVPLLHVAALRDSKLHSTVSIMKSYIKNINETNRCGQTALHLAAKNGNVNCVIELLAAGCNSSIVDRRGMKAYDVALKYKWSRCAGILSTPQRSSTPCETTSSNDKFDSGIAADGTDLVLSAEGDLVYRNGVTCNQLSHEDTYSDENNNSTAKSMKKGYTQDDLSLECLKVDSEDDMKCKETIIIDDDTDESVTDSTPDLICTFFERECLHVPPRDVDFTLLQDMTTENNSNLLELAHPYPPKGTAVLCEANLESPEMLFIASQPDVLAYAIVESVTSVKPNPDSDLIKKFLVSCRSHIGDLKAVVSRLLQLTGLIKAEGVITRHNFEHVCLFISELISDEILTLNEAQMIGYFVSKSDFKSDNCLKLLKICLARDTEKLLLSKDVTTLVQHWSTSCNYLAHNFPERCAEVIWDRIEPFLDRTNYVSFAVGLIEHLGLIKTEHRIHTSVCVDNEITVLTILRQRSFFPSSSDAILNLFLNKRMKNKFI